MKMRILNWYRRHDEKRRTAIRPVRSLLYFLGCLFLAVLSFKVGKVLSGLFCLAVGLAFLATVVVRIVKKHKREIETYEEDKEEDDYEYLEQ